MIDAADKSMIEKIISENTPQERVFTMTIALDLMTIAKGTNILETGTTRLVSKTEGAATIAFAKYIRDVAKRGRVWTVDLNEEAIDNCKELTKHLSEHISYKTSCSVDFIKNFDEKIDLLYLDSLEDSGGLGGGREHQLEEAKAALEKIHKKTIILLDDTDIANFDLAHTEGGKGILSVPFLISSGWTVINSDGCQAVLIDKEGWPELRFIGD